MVLHLPSGLLFPREMLATLKSFINVPFLLGEAVLPKGF